MHTAAPIVSHLQGSLGYLPKPSPLSPLPLRMAARPVSRNAFVILLGATLPFTRTL
jgi:hypothetical protein